MFRRILVANRGEVARRITNTAKRLGIGVVAVASDADIGQVWLNEVDQVVSLGPAPAAASYLDMDAILSAAIQTGCSAIHPGWGFLSENAEFASKCEAAGITFIGPSPAHMTAFGDKAVARATMAKLGMPLIPGTEALESVAQAQAAADEIGYPVLLKAVSGGGGRGMRGVDTPEDLKAAFEEASAEAIACFGDGRLYLEKRIVNGRHVEVQVIADRYGHCLHLGERECSIQRRHQKVTEEAPSPGLSSQERERILPLVADVVGRSGYVNAGTVEMLLDASGHMYFMEMNTRLQVEHSISEETTGLDIVELQLLVAAGGRLPLTQEQVTHQGHAIELRINAEDPAQDFKPSPGRITKLLWPKGEGVRVDTHLTEGDKIPPNYDSMIAKIICHGPDRATAIQRCLAALDGTIVQGVTTNIELHRSILQWEPFVSGDYNTTSLEGDLLAGGA